MTLRVVRRGGEYVRVADPAWDDPLDGSHAMRTGGRWNPPNSFPIVYLNAGVAAARANVALRFEGRPFSPEDLDPAEAPVLVSTQVGAEEYVDIVTNAGCLAAGLPATYPRERERTIPHSRCQPIGQRAWDEGRPGIACRSAARNASDGGEELAWFQRGERLAPTAVIPFESWFW